MAPFAGSEKDYGDSYAATPFPAADMIRCNGARLSADRCRHPARIHATTHVTTHGTH